MVYNFSLKNLLISDFLYTLDIANEWARIRRKKKLYNIYYTIILFMHNNYIKIFHLDCYNKLIVKNINVENIKKNLCSVSASLFCVILNTNKAP
jgi:hypothetical protein